MLYPLSYRASTRAAGSAKPYRQPPAATQSLRG